KSKSYSVIATGMRDRFLLSRDGPPQFNLHIVTWESWPLRKERLMRDALIADPEAAAEYAALKRELAAVHGTDMAAYTRAKTAFVQKIMDRVFDRMGLPRQDVWED
ncbi:GrpB family protein, partial [Tabrizicola sp.]|uniref:GrpB family protein n=1 Tax=Tabrizicola sp. TaxID=2005166 RepID=UPI003F3DA247